MTIHLYNTLSRTKEAFEPLKPDTVGMYVCGPTVYDYAHIGNARPVVVFDVLARLLRTRYANVTYVRNITDVDDKINQASLDTGEPIRSITERTAQAFHEDMVALGDLGPDIEPRATEHIDEMLQLIEKLIAAEHAYVSDGHVLFQVSSMAEYGKLSGRDPEELLAGARVEVADYKRDPGDFVLWKPSEPELPGWDSPWGRGRPGWHLECSAMSQKYLGVTFDIHGGGQDLIFPHHENEIAQSVCGHGGSPFVRYWMHNGYLQVEGEKMSKSLGNFYTVRDLTAEFPGEAIRFALLSTHYRQPMDFTKDGIKQAKETLDRFYGALRNVSSLRNQNNYPIPDKIMAALSDDLNTPLAISHLHELVGALNKAEAEDEIAELSGSLLAGAEVLGLLAADPEDWFKGQTSDAEGGLDAAAIEALIEERTAARAAKDFAASDRIRDELADQGIVLEDGADGTTWKRV
ncbi:MAG: cysteine--tRNA ligase [Rhodospirillaceae bacterium]|jgi:cysteinyl-tRNA synthetase|nr:cysteine--tRNA ligase [Rhodospirillaceae bacterium]MBT4702969.1 cysteine--tRNA ligase [Rhodospirillaceae bacterium]MBT5033516.1 cysteine--tRNA ligase [Rhodospirillaceae bacterium]MBT6219465.1 cysteine--tRNA ligase [Rhodospirillaceae bacterium]MBT6360993.1 cysteine--tRNA ligase [Rhodospirillaceae bacterium]